MDINESFRDILTEDLPTKFRRCYVGVVGAGSSGKVTEIAVVEGAARAVDGEIVFATASGANLPAAAARLWPSSLGFVNMQKTAVLVQRVPARQNSAGMTDSTTMCKDTDGNRVGLTSAIVRALFIRKYPNGYQAYRKMVADRTVRSQALSNAIAIARDDDDNIAVVLHGVNIGTLCETDGRLSVKTRYPDTIKRELGELCSLLKRPG